MLRRSVRHGAALALAAVALTALTSGPVKASGLPPGVQALIEGAKKEGEVTVYGRTLKPSAVRAFSKRLNAFYGFPIKLNMGGGFHTKKAAEAALAIKNKVPTGFDVFWTSYSTSVRLERSGVVQKVDWVKELGIPASLRASEYGIKSHDVSLCFVTYNTNLVKDSEAPRSWDDLLDPKWKGRIAMPRSPSPWIYLATAVGEEKATAMLTEFMAKGQGKMMARFPDVRAKVLTGEFALAIGTDAFKQMRQGAPVKMAPIDPIALSNWSFYLMSDTKSPNLAKLWAYWITTADGQQALNEIDGTGFVTTEGNDLNKLAAGKKIGWLTREYVQENGLRLRKKFGKIMGLR